MMLIATTGFGCGQSGQMANNFTNKLQRLSHLTLDEVTVLDEATAVSHRVVARQDLIREGDRPGPLFVILEGWACRYKILPNGGRQILAYLMPGDCCDLHSDLIAEMDHSIQTITPALVARIERIALDEILERYPRIARALYRSQLIDDGTLRAWITSMGRRSSLERVAHLMCELYLRARNVGVISDECLELPLSQTMLADSLGMTPVHLNRVLKTLRGSGAMTFGRKSLIIAEPAKLGEIAGFDDNYLHRRLRTAA